MGYGDDTSTSYSTSTSSSPRISAPVKNLTISSVQKIFFSTKSQPATNRGRWERIYKPSTNKHMLKVSFVVVLEPESEIETGHAANRRSVSTDVLACW